jgi:hypothetical protein
VTAEPGPVSTRPAFAHASEAELARILDFYQVQWEYEPDTELDLYVELTTLKQKLVRKKNRKLRRLRELYPDIRIKLFYARDFRMLLLKFGRLALLDDLSGSTGQATPPRPADRIVVEAAAGLLSTPEKILAGAAEAEPHTIAELGEADESAAPERVAGPAHTPRGRRRGRRRRRDADQSMQPAQGVTPVPETESDADAS